MPVGLEDSTHPTSFLGIAGSGGKHPGRPPKVGWKFGRMESIMRDQAKALDQMTQEQRAAVEAIRARRHTPEADAERERSRGAIREEIPPASLRAERDRQGLSLADIGERTQIDKATLSKLETGKTANPTYFTLRTYARALGKGLAWRIEEAVAANGQAHGPGRVADEP